ncbi:ATP-binding protein [Sporosarcina sp. FSL K6-1508]|uniref:ATP-binding protein n=1 Tax=Sporosarcina sp. FSL K6-1508 TaxID=2921553 RepID=UPI0030F588D2
MRAVADVMGRVSNARIGTTSEICYEHEVQANGKEYVKEIKKISFDGEVFCPLCERNRTTQELSDHEDMKIKQSMNRRNYNAFHNQSVLTDIGLLDASFGSYEAGEPETETAVNKKRALDAFDNYKQGKMFNTWFTGVPGVGKSHLAMSILRNLNESGEKDKSCLFVSVDEMLSRIRNSFDDKESRYTEHYFSNLLSSVNFLVLDDLGAETGATGTDKRASDFTMRVLYAIANGRRDKSTIVTSNLSKAELVKMYDGKLVSRLMGAMYKIHFKNTVDKRIREVEF